MPVPQTHNPQPTTQTEDSNDLLSGDANSLIVDLNDLLKRDPTLSSLSDDTLAVDVDASNFDFMNVHVNPTNSSSSVGMEIPRSSFANLLV